MEKKSSENLLATGPPTLCSTEDYGCSKLKTLTSEIDRELRRHEHLAKLKIARARGLLIRLEYHRKKLQAIREELTAIVMEEVSQP